MKMLSLCLAAAAAVATAADQPAVGSSPNGNNVDVIDTVVVMMLENRAFDHMLGYMSRGGPFGDTRVDGLTGTECNPTSVDPAKANDTSQVCVNDEALDHCPYDPNHSFAATTERIFACQYGKTPGTPCNNMTQTDGNNSMQGFVASAVSEGKDGKNEMTMWPPEKVPIITTLAKEYVVHVQVSVCCVVVPRGVSRQPCSVHCVLACAFASVRALAGMPSSTASLRRTRDPRTRTGSSCCRGRRTA